MGSQVVHTRKGFEFVLVDERVFVRTPLQAFLLYAPTSKSYINEIRSEIEFGRVECLNDLVGMFYDEEDNCKVNMIATSIKYYV